MSAGILGCPLVSTVSAESTERQLAWEKRSGVRAGIAAIAAGILMLAAGIYTGLGFRDIPQAHFLESIDLALKPGPIGDQPSLRIPLYQFYSDHFIRFVIAALLNAFGSLAAGFALTYLAFATRARRPAFPRIGVYVAFVGASLLAVGVVLYAFGTGQTVDAILAGPRTVDAVHGVKGGSLLVAGQLIEVVGRFALGAAYVLVSLNAMRTGLLTRFMGVLGILVGVLMVLPLLQGPPVVQSFWLVALGVLFLGRWPRGVPPAWRTGDAEPWPSGSDARAARMAGRPRKPGRERPAPEPDREPDRLPAPERPQTAHPSSKKRKRKRRG
jgi:hypothetical protein